MYMICYRDTAGSIRRLTHKGMYCAYTTKEQADIEMEKMKAKINELLAMKKYIDNPWLFGLKKPTIDPNWNERLHNDVYRFDLKRALSTMSVVYQNNVYVMDLEVV